MQNFPRVKWRWAKRTIILWDDLNSLIWSFTRSSLQFYLHRLQWRFKGSASAWCIHHHQIRTSALRVSKVSKNLKICTWKILFVKANKPLIWQQLDWICPVRDTLNDNDFAYYEAINLKLVFRVPLLARTNLFYNVRYFTAWTYDYKTIKITSRVMDF